MPLRPVKDFTPIAPGVATVNMIAASTSGPAASLRELIEYAKKNPGKVTYSTSGTGSVLHMIAEIFAQQAGVTLVHVPYKGSGPAMTAVLTGEVDLGFTGTAEVMPLAKAGKVRVLAMTESFRYKPLPDTRR